MTEDRIAHYRILRELGSGGMGRVLLAEDTQLGRKVALKILPPDIANDLDRQARLRREAQAIAALNHPNIVTVYAVDQADGRWYLTMELVDGRTLSDMLTTPISMDQFQEIAAHLTDAVAAAHAHGVIHRDLKPANIMITKEGRVKVLDFGLAKFQVVPNDSALTNAATDVATGPDAVVGTTDYMSPEQLQGLPADERSDVFSLGVTLFELATGCRPFTGKTRAEKVTAILRDAPAIAEDVRQEVPHALSHLIDTCLRKAPEQRPSAREMHQVLTNASVEDAKPHIRSVAVLPFADLSQDRDQDYLCEGLADELMNAFTKIEGLKVASRTSCMQFKGAAGDIRKIGRKIGVDTIVEGSVRKAGNKLRISAQLTKVGDGYQLWAERYDRELEDVFEIQEDIARRIVSALEITLSPRERRALQRVQTANPRAYEFYLRGRQYLFRLDRRSLEFGRDMFQQAIDLDANYALAFCGIADSSACLYLYHGPQDDLKLAVDHASARALELDPQLAEAHASRGQAFLVAGDYQAADAEFATAIQLDPKLFEGHYFYGRSAFAQGKLDVAGEMFAKASALRLDDYQTHSLQALVHKSRGDHDAKLAAHRKALERIRTHLALNPDDVRARYLGAQGLIEIGEREEGLKWARRALEMDPRDAHVRYNVACALAIAGEKDEAISCLEQVVTSLGASAYMDWIANDPDFEMLRSEPRFAALMKRLRE